MKLPDWAERALEFTQPLPAHGSDSPHPDRLHQWQTYTQRFRAHWGDLAADGWRVPANDDAVYRDLRKHLTHSPGDYVRQCILEAAIMSAWEQATYRTPDRLKRNISKLAKVNQEISKAAGQLAALLRERDGLQFDYLLDDYLPHCDETAPDPLRLMDAYRLAMGQPEFSEFAFVASREIETFFTVLATHDRPAPTWAALLDEMANQGPRIVAALLPGDQAVTASKTGGTLWSAWALRLIGRLDERGGGLPEGFLLGCLSNEQLAALATLATPTPEDVTYSATQMKELVKRYRKRKPKPAR